MQTAKSRVIIRHLLVLSLLIFLTLAEPHYWQRTKAEGATSAAGLPTLRGETALTHLKEQGLYSSLSEAAKAARHSAQLLPPGIAPLLAQSARLTAGDGSAEAYFAAAVAISGDTAIVGAPRTDFVGNADQGAAYIFVRSGGNWTQQAKLKTKTDTAGDFFGGSVAISGDTVIVGAYLDDSVANVNQGAVYVFTRSAGLWLQQDKLKVDDGGANDFFGFSVAIDGDTALIGAHLNDTSLNTNQGAAYVFTRSDGAWSQTQKLAASDAAAGDLFGFSVALDAKTAVIGASGKDKNGATGAGSAYVFTLSGGTWTPQQKLLPDISAADNFFGAAVAISGDTALIGSFGDDIGASVDQGSAVVFVRSGSTWTKQQKLTTTDGAAGDMFGLSVALYADTAVIGAIGDDINGADQGSAYVFSRTGLAWSQQPRLLDALGETNDKFGAPVAISGDTVLIGASFDDVGGNANQGSASAFVIRQGLAEQQKLTAAYGAAGDSFGDSVAICGDTAVVGATHNEIGGNEAQGSVNVFVRDGSTWTHQQRLTASDGTIRDFFGNSVAISGDTVVIGASYADIGGNADQGSVYVFTRSGATWTQQEKLTASGGAADDHLGHSVAICGDTIVAGAINFGSYLNPSQGWAYIFERSGATWTQQQRLTASDGASVSTFGISVAISGDAVVAGAQYADVGANAEQGAAYVFAGVACPAITLGPPSLPNGAAGSPYNWSITATGGSGLYNYSVSSGTLPTGLTLNPTTGSLSGTPTMAGSYDFTITATDGSLCPGSHDYTLVIDCPIIGVRPANPNLPPGQVGAPYARTFTASGGLAPYSFSIRAGALPSGLTLDPATGVLSGAPSASGTFNFAIQAADSGGCSGTTAYVLTINCPTINVEPANSNLPNGVVGTAYNQAISTRGGAEPIICDVVAGAAPDGLTLNAATGVLSGVPTARGIYNFVIRATDSNGCVGRRPYQIIVN